MRRDVKAYEMVEMDSRSKEKLLALANERKVALKQENTYLGRIRSFGTVRNVVSVSCLCLQGSSQSKPHFFTAAK